MFRANSTEFRPKTKTEEHVSRIYKENSGKRIERKISWFRFGANLTFESNKRERKVLLCRNYNKTKKDGIISPSILLEFSRNVPNLNSNVHTTSPLENFPGSVRE